MLMLHTLTTQNQQLANPLRPDPISLHTKISATLRLNPYIVPWNDHTLSPALDRNTWPIGISISQEHTHRKIPLSQGSECHHQLHLDILSNLYCFKFTYKQFPEDLAGWLVYSPDHPLRIVITHDAYFEVHISSAFVFNSKPSARAIPFNSH
jgi:hypothetical protein